MIVDIDTIVRHFAPVQQLADELTRKSDALTRRTAERKAAAAGGFKANGSTAEIERAASEERADFSAQLSAAADTAREKIDAYLRSCFAICLDTIERWVAPLGAIAFTDDDLRDIARRYRNYPMLRCIASGASRQDSTFAKGLNRELARYRTEMDACIDKLFDAARRAVRNDAFPHASITPAERWQNGRAEAIFDEMRQLNDRLDAFIDGTTQPTFTDPIMNRLAAMADD